VRFITVNQEERTVTWADKVAQEAEKNLGLRISIDNSNESVGKKIRAAELAKVPYILVVGDKEVGGGEVVPRIRKDIAVNEDAQAIGLGEFLLTVSNEAKSRVHKTSLHG
jgi:threonyl-tRNA synthetase